MKADIDLEEFLRLRVELVAGRVRQKRPLVCAIAVNGTRRWFELEHLEKEQPAEAYLEAMTTLQINLGRMFFEHGVHTLLMPVFGPDLIERGEAYMQMAAEGMARLATHPQLLDFYKTCQVQVRFYGDYRSALAPTPYSDLSGLFDQLTERTRPRAQRRLLYGVFAHDPTQTVAQLSIQFFQQYQRVPTQQELVEAYYGEAVPPVDLFIGFGPFCAFDMPLLSSSETDLYFTVSPTPYLTPQALRRILYDHLYVRHRDDHLDYATLSIEDWQQMRAFYRANADLVAGVGMVDDHGIWYSHLPMLPVQPGTH